jgi:hypothetical protein
MQPLAPVSLTAELMPQAFPLARAFAPDLDLESWLEFGTHRLAAGTGGIVGLRDERGYFRGLFGYQVRNDPLDGAVLQVDMAVTLDLVNRAEAAAALTGEIDGQSRKLGCTGVQICLRPEQRWLRRWFERHGYQIRAVTFAKPQTLSA